MTQWTARRIGDRIVCGRQVAGRFVCQGEIAKVVRDVGGREFLRVRPGVTPEWIEGEEGPRFRLTKRAHFPVGRQSAGMFRKVRRFPFAGQVGDSPPLWCPCPHCGLLNWVARNAVGRYHPSNEK